MNVIDDAYYSLINNYKSLLSSYSTKELQDRFIQITRSYSKIKKFKFENSIDSIIYFIARFPATRMVCSIVIKYLVSSCKTLTDCGGGSGAFVSAFIDHFSDFKEIKLLDQSSIQLNLARKFFQTVYPKENSKIRSICTNLEKTNFIESDVFSFSYSLGEIQCDQRSLILQKAWENTGEYLIIIEPGTPKGFLVIEHARKQLLLEGAFIVAPCTHSQQCPMKGKDWCHFATRVVRDVWSKKIKQGQESIELEKYSFIIFSKKTFNHDKTHGRIIKRPMKRPGHILLDICTQNGMERLSYSKKNKKNYHLVKKVNWGDKWCIIGENKE